MRRLLRKDTVVPGGFSFRHAETGHTTHARDWWTWVEKAKEHRRANNLPIPDNFVALMEDQQCQSLSAEWCQYDDGSGRHVDRQMTFKDLANGFVAYAKLLLGKIIPAEQSEAERRAQICAHCFLNVNPTGCGICSAMADMIVGDVKDRHTSHDKDLKACAVCKCPLAAIVHFPMDALEANDTEEKQELYPGFCWRKKGGINYVSEITAVATT